MVNFLVEFSTPKFSVKFRIPGNCNDSSDDKDVNSGDLHVDKVAAVDVVVVIVAVVGAISINVNIAQRQLMQCSINAYQALSNWQIGWLKRTIG